MKVGTMLIRLKTFHVLSSTLLDLDLVLNSNPKYIRERLEGLYTLPTKVALALCIYFEREIQLKSPLLKPPPCHHPSSSPLYPTSPHSPHYPPASPQATQSPYQSQQAIPYAYPLT